MAYAGSHDQILLSLKEYEPQSRFARLWLDSQHDNLPKGIRTIKMCKLYSNDALVMANGLSSIVKENV